MNKILSFNSSQNMENTNSKKKIKKIKTPKQDLIKHIESKYKSRQDFVENSQNIIEVGNIIRIAYLIPEGDKERTQYYEGLIIAKNNRTLSKSFILRRTVQGVGIEQIFVLNSPKIISITRKQASKIRRSKLYFIRNLRGKSTRLKVKL
jgi:large subunit ribosomal protein L19